jgi:transcriptional regulator with XRE-family HTH domain
MSIATSYDPSCDDVAMRANGPEPPTGEAAVDAERRRELATFLRAQRARLRPSDLGIPSRPGQRRTPGLRREELAEHAGIGLTWYTWLEQARRIPVSSRVIDALARALRLDPDQYRYLRTLAELPVPAPVPPSDEVLPRLQRLVDAQAPAPAAVYDVHYDYLVWNEPYVRVRHDPGAVDADRRNWLWFLFTNVDVRARMRRWEPAARAVLGQFRIEAGQRAPDPRFHELVAALMEASPEFRTWWAEYPTRRFRPTTICVHHPMVGPIELELFQLNPVEHPDLRLVVQVPASDRDRRRVCALLA